MQKPKIMNNDAGRQVTETFGGINRALKIREGEWNETVNLSSDNYPLLSTRQAATLTAEAVDGNVIDMLDNDGLYVLYVKDGEYYLRGGTLRHAPLDLGHYGTIRTPTGLVSLASYIIVLGANIWYKTTDGTSGRMDAVLNVTDATITDDVMRPYVLKLCPCDEKGNELRIQKLLSAEDAAALEANTQQIEVDPGECYAIGSERKIRKYRENTTDPEPWLTMPHFLRVEAVGIDTAGMQEGDIIDVSGLPTEWTEGVYVDDIPFDAPDQGMIITHNRNGSFDDDPNGYREVALVGEGFIVLKNVFYTRRVNADYSAVEGAYVGRKVPDMDFVIESQNRLWGCKYGVVNGETVNEIYASALGDFKNWRRYDGTSMASYAASIGSDGRWTGAISYNGSPMFFKENRLHKVFVSSYGAHQILEYTLDGVAESCDRSLCEVDGRLYWVGLFGIYAYDGSLPAAKISTALGNKFVEHLVEASAGGADKHVYFYLEHDSGDPGMTECYVYDVARQAWNIVHDIGFDNVSGKVNPVRFCPSRNCVYAVGRNDGNIIDLFGNEGTQYFEDPVEWSCTSGLIGWGDIEQKYMSHLVLRVLLARGSQMSVWIEYDSDGKWNHAGSLKGTSGATKSYVLPVRPRRCDHFRIKLSGTGDMALYSLSKMYQKGSDVV